MLTSKMITDIIESHCEFSGCTNSCKNCFKSTLINHEITYDTVTKRHLRLRCPYFGKAGAMPLSCPRSPASLANNYAPWDAMQNSMGIVVDKAEAFNTRTRLCAAVRKAHQGRTDMD